MLTDSEQQRAMANCERVRNAYPVKSLQVRPDPDFADNVWVRLGQGPWRKRHVLNALMIARNAYYRQRGGKIGRRRALVRIEQHRITVDDLSKKEQLHRLRLRAALNDMFNVDTIKARRDALLAKGIVP